LREMAGIGVDKAGDLADRAGGGGILRLENLDTDLRPPNVALERTRLAIEDDRSNSYLPFLGQARLRDVAAAHVARISGIAYSGSRNVIVSAGGLSGILNVLLAVVAAGDEVVLTDPTYVGLINRVVLAGGVPKLTPLVVEEREWRLDRDALRAAVTEKTRALLLMSPSMPSGACLDREDWELVAEIAVRHDLWVIYDAAMERILFDGRTVIHPAGFARLAERTITVGAASKELRMIGWRVGWIVAPETLMPDLELVSMANVVTPVGIAQEAVAAALELGDREVAIAVAEWQRRRDTLLEELRGLPVVRPAGGWSLLIDGTPLGLTGAQMAERLFRRAGIAATPMGGWGRVNGSQFLRMVFSNESVERLRGIGERVKAALQG